jgi:hypothetical protein
MIKVSVSWPNETYELIKRTLKTRKITLSEYICSLIEKEMKRKEK